MSSEPDEFIHDSYLVSYDVHCGRREICLHAEYPRDGQGPIRTDIRFAGVEAYHLEYDAFGNIIFEIEPVSSAELYRTHRPYIEQAHYLCGAPGPWAASESDALAHLAKHKILGFVLDSSYGMRGWILARSIDYQRL